MAITTDQKQASVLILMVIATLFLWNTPVIFPFKIFVVLLHELSHGLAAVLTGGRIVSIELSANQGGLCTTQGGWPFVVLSAGYLGSMLWGGLILLAAARTKLDKFLSMFIGVAVITITFLLIRSSFGFVFGLVFGAALFAIGKFMSEKVNDFLLRYIGLTSMLYAVFDIKDDLITRTVAESDASVIAQHYFGTSLMWGILWIVLALTGAYVFIRMSLKPHRR